MKCCQREGFVYVSDQDIARLADHLNLPVADFERLNIYRTKNTARLRMRGGCPFLKDDGCSVHPAKPTQCRTFPFWPELIEDSAQWNEAASWCPGMNRGDLVPLAALQASAREMRTAYPHMYPIG